MTRAMKQLAMRAMCLGLLGVRISSWAAAGPGPCVLICPADIRHDNEPWRCGATIAYTVPTPSDGCTGLSVACNPPPGFFAIGSTVVHCMGSDAQGNSVAGCSFNVIITDTQAPQMTVPADITRCADPGQSSGIVQFSVDILDNCGASAPVCTP